LRNAQILSLLGSDPENPDADPLRPDAMNIVNLAKAILVKLKVKSVQLDIRICGRVAVLVCFPFLVVGQIF
jgi:hypothetical protein